MDAAHEWNKQQTEVLLKQLAERLVVGERNEEAELATITWRAAT